MDDSLFWTFILAVVIAFVLQIIRPSVEQSLLKRSAIYRKLDQLDRKYFPWLRR